MSDDDKTEVENPSDKPASYWAQFIGRPCLLQLRDGVQYLSVTYPDQPASEVVNNAENQPVRVPVLRPFVQGTLKDIGEDASGVRLLVGRQDPVPDKNATQVIVLHTGDVAFATFTEARLIATI